MNRILGNEDVGLSTQIAAIYAVAELGKRHSMLKNIVKEGLTSVSMWKVEDKISEISIKAVDALKYLDSK